MNKGLLAIALAASVSGCAGTQAREQAEFQAANDQRAVEFVRKADAIGQAVKDKKMTPAEGSAAMHDLCVLLNAPPGAEEFRMHWITLIERELLGELTLAQATYMHAQKRAELMERERIANAEAQQRYEQERANNMSCVTIPLNWGGQVTKCH